MLYSHVLCVPRRWTLSLLVSGVDPSRKPASVVDRGLTLAAIGMSVVALWAVGSRLLERPRDPPRTGIQGSVRDFLRYRERGQERGGVGAAATVVVYSDFFCPFCRALARDYDSLQRATSEGVRIVFRHLPMQVLHPRSREFAHAAECAADAGRFWAFHDAAFAAQDSLERLDPWDIAVQAGVVDSAGFAYCMLDPAIAARVTADSTSSDVLGARGTPTFLVEDVLVVGSLGYSVLDSLVRARITRNRPADGET